jgi:glycosyltransferase involved in cell wall biosynthesis
MIRVAFLTDSPTPYRDPLFERISQLADIEMETLFCTSEEPGRSWHTDRCRFPHQFLKGRVFSLPGKDSLAIKINPGILHDLEGGHFDAVVVGGYFQPTMQMAMIWCRRHEVPYVLLSESHGLTQRPQWKQILRKPLIRFFVKGASSFLTMGSRGRDYLVSYGADPGKVFFFPNTPDVERLREEMMQLQGHRQDLRREMGFRGDPLVLFVGRLVAVKNIQTLLRAFSLLQRESPNVGLIIGGDGPLLGELQALAVGLGISNHCFTGAVRPADIARYYASADIFALPSHSETWGVVVLEALACGLPVVVSDRVGASELLEEGRCGFALPVRDSEAWCAALRRLLGDSSLRREMGDRGREVAKRHGYEFCISELRKALDMALGAR